MISDSNFYILSHYKLPEREKYLRLQYLEDTLRQLEDYHRRALKPKSRTIAHLICAYESLIQRIGDK